HVGQGIVGILINGLQKIVPRFVERVGRALVPIVAALEVELVSLGIGSPPVVQFGLLCTCEPLAETRGNFSGNLALYGECVGELAVVLLAPQTAVGANVSKLRAYEQRI